MAKRLTKTETKRLYAAILSKTKKLWAADAMASYLSSGTIMSTPDLVAIEKIIHKYQKKL